MIGLSLKNAMFYCSKYVTALQITHTPVYLFLCPYHYVCYIFRSRIHLPLDIINISSIMKTNIHCLPGVFFPG